MRLPCGRALRRRFRRIEWPVRFTLLTLLGMCILVNLNIYSNRLYYVLFSSDSIVLPNGINLTEFEPFEPEVFLDFNEKGKSIPKIERIIHQTWINRTIPPHFINNMVSYVQNNPSWKYFLWTDDSARKLISDYYPQLLDVWDGPMYSKYTIRRADALRYVVLYHFGGVYADLDTVNARSLDNAITKHPCVFTPEPYEHAVIRAFVPYLLSNAVMMCTSGHPFLKHLIANLHRTEHYENSVDSTGPGFITAQYMLYNDLPQEQDHLVLYNGRRIENVLDTSPYFNTGDKYPMASNESVYIANTRYFMYTLDLTISSRIIEACFEWSKLTHLTRRACVSAKVLGLNRQQHKFAFIEHQWFMTWINWKTPEFRVQTEMVRVDIRDIIPDYTIYGEGT